MSEEWNPLLDALKEAPGPKQPYRWHEDPQPQPLSVGMRVRLIDMPDDPEPVPVGTYGTVRILYDPDVLETLELVAGVDWDNGRKLNLMLKDSWVVIEP